MRSDHSHSYGLYFVKRLITRIVGKSIILGIGALLLWYGLYEAQIAISNSIVNIESKIGISLLDMSPIHQVSNPFDILGQSSVSQDVKASKQSFLFLAYGVVIYYALIKITLARKIRIRS